jgi:hypothetical protein
MGSKVLRHPEKEEIISKLLQGESVKQVENWLKKKHPKTKRLHITSMTLQKFRKEYLNLEGEALEQIKAARKNFTKDSKALEKQAMVMASNSYQEKLAEIIDEEIDVTRKMLEMEKIISSRIEYYFNSLNSGANLREERVFIELLTQQRELLRDWKKYVERVPDQTIDHNININVVNEQLTVLKSIVFEVLKELDPTLIPVFVEKLNSKMVDTQYNNQRYLDYVEPEVKIIDVSND